MTEPRDVPVLDAEVLLIESGWLRRFARALVGEADADDVVQDTMVAAMRHPRGRIRELRPWLMAVARHLAHRKARRDDRRRRAERAAAAGRTESAGAPADDAIGRAELHRAVVDTVLGLAEPYRSILLLRYLEGHPLPEVARRMQVSCEAAKTRQKRGLAMVRARMDVRYGDRRAWAAPLCGWPAVTANLALPILLMSAKTKLILTAAAMLLASLLFLQYGREVPVDAGVGGVGVAAARDRLGAAPRAAGAEQRTADATREVAAATPASAPTMVVTGVVVEEELRTPIAGARVEWVERTPVPGPVRAAAPAVTTGGDGRFAIATTVAEPQGCLALRFRAAGHATWIEDLKAPRPDAPKDPWRVDIGAVTLPPGTAVAGRVVDAAGRPVAGAALLAGLHWSWRTPADGPSQRTISLVRTFAVATADVRGEFRLTERLVRHRAPPVLVACSEQGLGWAKVELARKRSTSAGNVVTLLPGGQVGVTVVGPDGAPVPGARVVAEPRFAPLGLDTGYDEWLPSRGPLHDFFARETDAAGAARFTGLPATEPARFTLRVAADGFATVRTEVFRPRAEGVTTLRVELGRAPRYKVAGAVRRRGGAPLAGAAVTVRFGARRSVRTDVDGRFELDDLPGGPRPLLATAAAAGFTSQQLSRRVAAGASAVEVEGEVEGEVKVELEFELEPAAALYGVVEDQDGQPVADALVYVEGLHVKKTDRSGAFRFDAVATGRPHRVQLTPPAMDWGRGVEHFAAPAASPLRLVLERPSPTRAALRAEVVDEAGAALELARARLWYLGGGVGRGFRECVAKIGVVTAAGLRDGRWQLDVEPKTGHGLSRRFTVRDGEVAVRLRLEQSAGGVVDGDVGVPDGADLGRGVDLRFGSGSQSARFAPVAGGGVAADVVADGARCRLRPGAPLAFRVVDVDPARPLEVVAVAAGGVLRGRALVRVEAGKRAVARLQLGRTARLRLRLAGGWPAGGLAVQVRASGGAWQEAIHMLGASGSSLPPLTMSPGAVEWRVVLGTSGSTNAGGRRTIIGATTLPPGVETEVLVDRGGR